MKFNLFLCFLALAVCSAEPSSREDDGELSAEKQDPYFFGYRKRHVRFARRRSAPWNLKKLRNKIIKKLLKPTCAGCAGICERKVPGKCRCYIDYKCLKRRGDEMDKQKDPLFWWRAIKWTLRPTCAGCAGLCERKVPGRCACQTDYACLRRRGDEMMSDIIDGKIGIEELKDDRVNDDEEDEEF